MDKSHDTKQAIKAHSIGFSDPYILTHQGKILFQSGQDRERVEKFLTAYQSSYRSLATLLLSVVDAPETKILGYYLLRPAKVPAEVAASVAFRDLSEERAAIRQAIKDGVVYTGEDWDKLASSDYQLWRTVFGQMRGKQAEVVLQEKIKKYGWELPDGKKTAAFGSALAAFPSDGMRERLVADVSGLLRSYLSQSVNWHEEQERKNTVLAALRGQCPEFFSMFENLATEDALWRQFSRILDPVRKELKAGFDAADEQTARQKLAVNQRVALGQKYPGSLFATAPHENVQCLVSVPAVKKIVAALPDTFIEPEYQRDRFARIGRPGPASKLADSPYVMRQLVRFYNAQFGDFSPEEIAGITAVLKKGKRTVLTGWIEACRNKAAKYRKMKLFFQREVSNYILARRESLPPKLGIEMESWPMFAHMRDGIDEAGKWRPLWDGEKGKNGNELAFTIIIPAFESFPKLTVTARWRANATLFKSAAIEPRKIANGLSQFFPNRSVNMPGETRFKLQGLRVVKRQSGVMGLVSTTNTTFMERDAEVRREHLDNVRPGERVGILDYLPGGDRLGSLGIFEKDSSSDSKTGWRRLAVPDVVSLSHRGDGKRTGAYRFCPHAKREVRVFNTGVKNRQVMHLSAANYLKHEADRAERARQAGIGNPLAGQEAMSSKGRMTTEAGKTWARQTASRIVRALVQQKVGYLVVCGGGNLLSQGVRVPVTRFFSPNSNEGALVNACRRAGITVLSRSGKPRGVFAGGFLRTGNTADLSLGTGFRLPSGEGRKHGTDPVVNYGRKTRIGIAGCEQDFGLNSTLALLLYHTDEKFKGAADGLLKTALELDAV